MAVAVAQNSVAEKSGIGVSVEVGVPGTFVGVAVTDAVGITRLGVDVGEETELHPTSQNASNKIMSL